MSLSLGLGLALTRNKGGVPALAWRFPDTLAPVRRAEGGYWLRTP